MPNTHVLLAIRGDVSSGLVKTVIHTAALAGFTNLNFVVERLPGEERALGGSDRPT